MSSPTYTEYETPARHVAYSLSHLSSLTFAQAYDISYPVIAPQNSITWWDFEDTEPSTAAATLVRPQDTVFHRLDLLPIINLMKDEYAKGRRSVRIFYWNGYQHEATVYHFSKVRLAMHINTFSGPIHHAQQLVSHFYDSRIAGSPLFSNDIFETLLRSPINQPICGFYCTDFPLWKLGYLLDENWVEEDVMNAAAELCYFRMFAQPPTGAAVNHFFLPIFFATELELCFRDGRVTPQLAALRRRIRYTDGPLQIGFLHWKQDHYTAYLLGSSTDQLVFGDSLHGNADERMLAQLKWAFAETGIALPTTIVTGSVDRQGLDGGVGSCSVAAFNFIESSFDPTVPTWRAATSAVHRNSLLRDLMVYNVIALNTYGSFEEWSVPLVDVNDLASLYQLFVALNERTDGQNVKEMRQARQSSRKQLDKPIEGIFPGILKICREILGPFALNTIYKQMELSLCYQTEVLQLPHGVTSWNDYASQIEKKMKGYEWEQDEDKKMISSFSNDSAFISTKWLLRLINGRGLNVKYLFRVRHLGPTGAEHYLAVLPDDRYICDCCMGLNLGVPCRHYFQVLSKSPNLRFNVGIVRARWYQDPLTDLSTIATVGQDNVTALSRTGINCLSTTSSSALSGVLLSNPLEKSRVAQATISNTTVPSQTVFHELQAAFRPLIAGVQTNEQLQSVLDHLAGIQATQVNNPRTGSMILRDPPTANPTGRPRTQRLTNAALEGSRRRGGGGAQRQRNAAPSGRPMVPDRAVGYLPGHEEPSSSMRRRPRCSNCNGEGHNRTTCPQSHNTEQ